MILISKPESDEREGLPSASSMWRTVNCAGWLQFCRDLPRKETKDSLSGTAGHAALAGESADLDSRQEMTVEECRKIRDKIVKEFGFEGCEVIKEKRFWAYSEHLEWDSGMIIFPRGTGQKVCSGQVDEMYLRPPDAFLIIDYKMLFGEHQAAPSNWQLRTLDMIVGGHFASRHVRLGDEMNSICAIIQPWKKGQFSTVKYTPEDRAESKREIYQAVANAVRWNPPRTPGEWCKHCPGRATCPEANKRSEAIVEIVSSRSMQSMTAPERGEMLTWSIWAQGILSEKISQLRAMIESDPLSVAGWGLKPGKNRRSITNVGAAKAALREHMSDQEVEALCTLTPAALEDYLYAVWNKEKCGGTRKEAKELIATELGDLVETKQDRESLVKL